MSLPRVLLLAPHFPPATDAAAARLGGLARELSLLGHDVRVIAPGQGFAACDEDASLAGLRILRIPVKPRGRGAGARLLEQLSLLRKMHRAARHALAAEPADVVLVSSPPPIVALAASGLDASGRPVPVVLDVRDIWPDVLIEAGALSARGPGAFALRQVERALLRGVTAVSTVTAAKVATLSRRTRAPVTLVSNGIDREWLDAPADERTGNGNGTAFEVTCAGNLGHAQQVEILPEAVALARARGASHVRATIVGEGERRDDVARAVSRAGSGVTLLPPESRASVRSRLDRAGAAFVSLRTAALADSVPSKLLEAMARATPVVLAAAGEAAAIVREAECGLVVTPGDASGLATALVTLAQMSKGERIAMGQRGRAYVSSHHRREDAARVMSSVLVAAAISPT